MGGGFKKRTNTPPKNPPISKPPPMVESPKVAQLKNDLRTCDRTELVKFVRNAITKYKISTVEGFRNGLRPVAEVLDEKRIFDSVLWEIGIIPQPPPSSVLDPNSYELTLPSRIDPPAQPQKDSAQDITGQEPTIAAKIPAQQSADLNAILGGLQQAVSKVQADGSDGLKMADQAIANAGAVLGTYDQTTLNQLRTSGKAKTDRGAYNEAAFDEVTSEEAIILLYDKLNGMIQPLKVLTGLNRAIAYVKTTVGPNKAQLAKQAISEAEVLLSGPVSINQGAILRSCDELRVLIQTLPEDPKDLETNLGGDKSVEKVSIARRAWDCTVAVFRFTTHPLTLLTGFFVGFSAVLHISDSFNELTSGVNSQLNDLSIPVQLTIDEVKKCYYGIISCVWFSQAFRLLWAVRSEKKYIEAGRKLKEQQKEIHDHVLKVLKGIRYDSKRQQPRLVGSKEQEQELRELMLDTRDEWAFFDDMNSLYYYPLKGGRNAAKVVLHEAGMHPNVVKAFDHTFFYVEKQFLLKKLNALTDPKIWNSEKGRRNALQDLCKASPLFKTKLEKLFERTIRMDRSGRQIGDVEYPNHVMISRITENVVRKGGKKSVKDIKVRNIRVYTVLETLERDFEMCFGEDHIHIKKE